MATVRPGARRRAAPVTSESESFGPGAAAGDGAGKLGQFVARPTVDR